MFDFCRQAPHPALMVSAVGGQLAWEANEAALVDRVFCRRSAAQWQALAAAAVCGGPPDVDATAGDLPAPVVQQVGEGRWLVWLRPPQADAGPDADLIERLRSAERRAALAAQAAGMGVWELDLATGERTWDGMMYALRGLDPDDPRAPNDLIPHTMPADDYAAFQAFNRTVLERAANGALADDELVEHRLHVIWPDGSEHWLASRGMIVRRAGQGDRILGVQWDVTERVLADRRADELAEAAQRSEDLKRQRLAAEQANHAKSLFLARMSHELRTPINALLGFAQLLAFDEQHVLLPKQHARVLQIREAGEHLLSLVNDTLDLASIEAGTLPVVEGLVSLPLVVDQALRWVEGSALKAGVRLVAGAVRGVVRGDPRRVAQIVVNLLSNGIKYNRKGGRVEVSTYHDAARQSVAIEVADTGKGMSPSQLERLYTPFERLGADGEGFDGTGIGLSLVRHLAQRMGGRIEVESQLNAGTRFRVWLRAEEGQVEALAPSSPSTPSATASESDVVDVLYVDDDPVNQLLVREILALRPGIELHGAPDGQTGLAKARHIRPALLLCDLNLPDLSGFEIVERLRREPEFETAVMIALSAGTGGDDESRARQSGFDDFWHKPIDIAHFLSGFDSWLSRCAQPAAG